MSPSTVSKPDSEYLLSQETFVQLQHTTECLVQGVVNLLKPFRLSISQYNVLRILRGAGTDGLLCQEVSARMITREPDMTRLLDRLEKMMVVSRVRDRADRRMVTVRIQPEGLAILSNLDEPMRALHQHQFAHVAENRLQLLLEILAEIRVKG